MILDFIKDILWPKKCYSCRSQWHFLCSICLNKISWFKSHCHICKLKSEHYQVHEECQFKQNVKNIYFNSVYIFKHYKNKYIKRLITDGKFYKKSDVFVELWEKMAYDFLYNNRIQNKKNYIIVYPWIHFLKQFFRWYNQSEILAKSFSKHTGIPYIKHGIIKQNNTRQQSHLSQKQRGDNLQWSFKINKKYIDILDKKNIIFIDDVISTGATFNEISKLLSQVWVREINGVFIASD